MKCIQEKIAHQKSLKLSITKEAIEINHKERVLAAVNLEEPDRVPIFLATPGFTEAFRSRLSEYLGISDPIELNKALDLDCGPSFPRSLILTEGVTGRIRKRLPDGSFIDEWGVTLRTPKDTDFIFLDYPLKSMDDFERHEFPEPPSEFDNLIKTIKEYGDQYPIIGGFGWALFERAWLLRGFTNFMIDLTRHKGFVDKLLDKILAYDIEYAKRICEYDIDIFYIGDDYGMQDRLLMSPKTWRKFFKPRLKKLLKVPKKRGLPVCIHSDGNISEIIPDLIEVGITILNPVQPLALDPAYVKQNYGDQLAQYGTIDIQKTLPFGTPEDVKNEVITRVQTVGYNGGLILATTHSVLPDTPVENFLAFVKAAKKYGVY